jgi:hypothetical protein
MPDGDVTRVIEPLQPESAMRQKSKSEDKASNEQHREAKPRKRVIRQRLGIDGKPEPMVTVMDHAPVHSMYLKAPRCVSCEARVS